MLETKINNYTSPADSLQNFRKWHVESLLNQAADLLDRCIRDRAEYYELRARWEVMNLENMQTILSIDLIQNEKDKKLWDADSQRLSVEINAHNEANAHLQEAARLLDVQKLNIKKLVIHRRNCSEQRLRTFKPKQMSLLMKATKRSK